MNLRHMKKRSEGENMSTKISIRFFNDREVRAAWDDSSNQWLFSVADIVGVLTESVNPRKYWSVLKTRLKKSHPELTTNCSQLKMTASDGKRYLTDCYAQQDILLLVEFIPSRHAAKFIKWFTYSDDTIDGKSRTKAYTLFESGILATLEPGTIKCLQLIIGILEHHTDGLSELQYFLIRKILGGYILSLHGYLTGGGYQYHIQELGKC